MRLERSRLLKAMSSLASIPRQADSIFGSILVSCCESGNVALAATDLDITARIVLHAQMAIGEKPWTAAVPARKIVDILKAIQTPEIEVLQNGESITIQAPDGKWRYDYVVYPAEDYPLIDTDLDGIVHVMPTIQFMAALSHVVHASADDGTPMAKGIRIRTIGNETECTATDGYRVALMACSSMFMDEGASIIISKKAAVEIIKFLRNSVEEVKVGVKNQKLYVSRDDGTYISTALLENDYPRTENVTDRKHDHICKVNSLEFLHSIKRILAAGDNDQVSMLMVFSPESIRVTAQSNMCINAEEIIPAECNIDSMSILMNAKYVLEALNQYQDDVEIQFSDKNDPVFIIGSGAMNSEQTLRSHIMPMLQFD